MPDQPKSRGWGFASMEKGDELILGQKDTKYDRSLILKKFKNLHRIRGGESAGPENEPQGVEKGPGSGAQGKQTESHGNKWEKNPPGWRLDGRQPKARRFTEH